MAANIYYEKDVDRSVIADKKVAILGYGSQGHAHALNLKESGIDVRVGLREGSGSVAKAHFSGEELSDSEIKRLYKQRLRAARGAFDPARARSAEARAEAQAAQRLEVAPPSLPATPQASPLDRLEELAELRELELIEEEEFQAVKRRLLAEFHRA